MKSLFFFGTLAHLPLLEVVLGRVLDVGQYEDGILPDFAAYWVKGQAYPMLAAQKGAKAKGLFVPDLTSSDMARLDFYEGGFGYTLKQRSVTTKSGAQTADVYFQDQKPSRGLPWNLADWALSWGDITVHAAIEAMGYYGQITAEQLAGRFDVIRRRAASYVRGQTKLGRHAVHGRPDVTVINQRTPYSNFYTMQEYDLRHRQFNGKMGAQIERAVFIGFDVAIVLPYDPVRDCVLLVEQFRIGAFARGADQPWLLEPIAGHVDAGETPEQAAMRETVEESGVHLTELIPICQAYPSPGDSTEYYHIYLGLCDLGGAGGKTAGLMSENEDIHSHVQPFDAFIDYIDRGAANGRVASGGGANVLPLITAAYWLARNRDRLRQNA